MKVIIEFSDTRRKVDKPFRIYSDAPTFQIMRDAIDLALKNNLADGWVEFKGIEHIKPIIDPNSTETHIYAWQKQPDEKPISSPKG